MSLAHQTVIIECPDCGTELKYEFKHRADWGTSCIHNQECPECKFEVAISLNVGCPDDLGIAEGWRPKS